MGYSDIRQSVKYLNYIRIHAQNKKQIKRIALGGNITYCSNVRLNQRSGVYSPCTPCTDQEALCLRNTCGQELHVVGQEWWVAVWTQVLVRSLFAAYPSLGSMCLHGWYSYAALMLCCTYFKRGSEVWAALFCFMQVPAADLSRLGGAVRILTDATRLESNTSWLCYHNWFLTVQFTFCQT